MIRYCFSCTKPVDERDAIRQGHSFGCPTCHKALSYLGREPVSLSSVDRFREYDDRLLVDDAGIASGDNYIDPALRPNLQRLECEELLSYNPRNVGALYQMGRLYQSEFEFKLAREYYEQVLAIDAAHVGAHQSLAELCIMNHQFNDAILHLDAVLGITPDDPQLHFNYAVAHYFAGRGGEAIRHLEIAKELSDDVDFLRMVNGVLAQLI